MTHFIIFSRTRVSDFFGKQCKNGTFGHFFDSALSPSQVVEAEGMPCWPISTKEPSSEQSPRSTTAAPLSWRVSNSAMLKITPAYLEQCVSYIVSRYGGFRQNRKTPVTTAGLGLGSLPGPVGVVETGHCCLILGNSNIFILRAQGQLR